MRTKLCRHVFFPSISLYSFYVLILPIEVLVANKMIFNVCSMEYYMQKTFYKTASLISNSSKSVAILAGQTTEVAMLAYEYGKNLVCSPSNVSLSTLCGASSSIFFFFPYFPSEWCCMCTIKYTNSFRPLWEIINLLVLAVFVKAPVKYVALVLIFLFYLVFAQTPERPWGVVLFHLFP